MGQLIIRRLLTMIPLLIGISIVAYGIIQFAPGDPTRLLADPEMLTEEQMEAARVQLGLDQPLHEQYVRTMTSMFTGDLHSFQTREPVTQMIADRLPTTLALTGASVVVGLGIGILVGVIQALRPYSRLDRVATSVTLFGFAVPNFWLALMMILIFSSYLGWFPASGIRPEGATGWNPIEMAPYLVLPTIVLATGLMTSVARYTRSSMLEAISQDYVRSARAKGLRERIVIGRHALRNSLLPVITLMGVQIPFLLGGAVAIETIFALPGLGRLALDAVNMQDYPVVITVNVFIAVGVLFANLIADILYAAVDPRIRYK